MLISYKNKFIFIHNRKVAGESIVNALKSYGVINPLHSAWLHKLCEGSPFGQRLNPFISRYVPFIPSFNKHQTAFDVKNNINPAFWQEAFKFGFVRNPWDLHVSLYHFISQSKNNIRHKKVKKLDSFRSYLEWFVKNWMYTQKDFFYFESAQLVDFIGRFENLENDFSYVTNTIGIDVSLPFKNVSRHKNYSEYYDTYTKDFVARHFQEDIELFGYTFGK
ncbi:sulfotransferase family 2 domain-containing protein [Patescibacteria group bacterium]